ncbi:MAG: hypothetical protein K0Q89_3009 [Thermomicrobiales bacterium]|jgi:hypothetical protein|nr:hypothetical protein [Thermomicrobiales bacterium]
MDGTEEAVAIIGVCIAVIGYFVKYRTDLRLAQRNDRLERINRQLSEFYGPLLALTRSSGQSWQAFRKRYRPPGSESFWKCDPPPTKEDAIAWRLWMTTVFMPVHRRMMELVLERADLIEEPEMPPSLLDLCAHVNGYQAILKEWEKGEISTAREDNISVVNFPGEKLAEYAATAFGRLKAEQAELLGATGKKDRSSNRT